MLWIYQRNDEIRKSPKEFHQIASLNKFRRAAVDIELRQLCGALLFLPEFVGNQVRKSVSQESFVDDLAKNLWSIILDLLFAVQLCFASADEKELPQSKQREDKLCGSVWLLCSKWKNSLRTLSVLQSNCNLSIHCYVMPKGPSLKTLCVMVVWCGGPDYRFLGRRQAGEEINKLSFS